MTGEGQGPLTETVYYTLLALQEPMHGYGIMQRVYEMSAGRVSIGPGTLYGALATLVERGLIEPVGEEGERKKVYAITSVGRAVVAREIERLEELVRAGHLVTGGSEER